MATKPTFSKEIDIVTGHQGKPHVTAAQDGRRIAGVVGKKFYILDIGDKFAIVVDSATQVTIGTGDAIIMGRHVTIEKPVTLSIKQGTQGMKRMCGICLRVILARGSGVDVAQIVVLDGEESADNPKDPTAVENNIFTGGITTDLALWLIPIDGITVGKPKPWTDYKILTSISAIKDEMKSEMQTKMKADIDRAKADIARVKTSITNLAAKFPREY